MRLTGLILGVLASIACCSCPRATSYPASDPLTCRIDAPQRIIPYQLDSRFTQDERDLIQQAMIEWRVGSGGRIGWAELPGPTSLQIIWLSSKAELPYVTQPNPDKVGVTSPRERRIWLVEPELWPHRNLFVSVVVHEIGHLLKLPHVAQEAQNRSCMTPEVSWWCADDGLPLMDREDYCRINGCDCNGSYMTP